mgnify:CR=1 FL=1
MEKQFNNEALIVSLEHDKINSMILEQASDVSEKLTELECKLNDITCYVVVMEDKTECTSYTEEAQDIFNIYYDEQVDELYKLLNNQLKIID